MEKRIETARDLADKIAELRNSITPPAKHPMQDILGAIVLPLDPRAVIGDIPSPMDSFIMVRFRKMMAGPFVVWDNGKIEHIPAHLKHLTATGRTLPDPSNP